MRRLRRRARAEPPPRPPEPRAAEPDATESIEQLLDVVAALLRSWGEFPIETAALSREQVAERFEGWARHALLGTPPPGAEGSASARRDWPAVRRFVADHRRKEQSFVQERFRDLREVVWTFIQTLGRSISQDRRTDHRMHEQLGKLRAAVDSDDTAELKREALRSVTMIESVIEARRARLESQVDELGDRLDNMAVELVNVQRELEKDALTQIHNRGALDEQLRCMVHLGTVAGGTGTAVLIDIDDFKWVNDQYGHHAGDEALKQVAQILARECRRKGDFVARFGGDEFVVLVPQPASEAAIELCERILFGIRDLELPSCGHEPLRISVSIGAANLERGDEVRDWLERADRALYQAKQEGRDRYVILPETGEAGGL